MRVADQPSQLEASPMVLMTSVHSNYSATNLFCECADFNPMTTRTSVDYMASLTE